MRGKIQRERERKKRGFAVLGKNNLKNIKMNFVLKQESQRVLIPPGIIIRRSTQERKEAH